MIEENAPLAPYTTFRLGGPGRYFVSVTTLEELTVALDFARAENKRTFILGGGGNVLVRDTGFDGLVVKIECAGVERTEEGYVAAAGESWDALVARAVGDGLWGLENLSDIPGSVGGACVQNIGAYGAALSQVLEWVEAYDTERSEVVRLTNVQCRFGYRSSIFKREPGRYVVLRARLALSQEPRPNLGYKDLAGRFEGRSPALGDIRQAVLAIRAEKFPDVAQEGTAGSFFLNPVLPRAEAEALKARYPEMPLFAMPETREYKVPLGWLLDHVLHLKGFAMGGARLFEKQALVIVAARGARASDVLALRDAVKKIVREKIHLEIQEEVTIL